MLENMKRYVRSEMQRKLTFTSSAAAIMALVNIQLDSLNSSEEAVMTNKPIKLRVLSFYLY